MKLTKLSLEEGIEDSVRDELQNPHLQGLVLLILEFDEGSSHEDIPPEVQAVQRIIQVYPSGVTLLTVPFDQVQAINDMPGLRRFQIVTNNYVPGH